MADFATRYRNARDAYRRARNGDATAEDEALIARLEADVAAARTPKACASVWDLPVARACYEGDRKGCAER